MAARRLDRLTARADLMEDGTVELHNPHWVKGMLQQYQPCPITVTYERRKSARSKEQLGYLWGVVYQCISEHTGHSPEELHEIFKAKFLRNKMQWRGAEMLVIGGTSRLTLNEMAEFITNVIAEAGEMGIEVPDPDKLYQFR